MNHLFQNQNGNTTIKEIEQNQKILAQIVALSMYRFSEEIFFQWNPKYFTEIMNKALTTIKAEELKETKGINTLKLNVIIEKTIDTQRLLFDLDHLNKTFVRLTESITEFNKEIEETSVLK